MRFHLHKKASLLASILLMSLLTHFSLATGSDATQTLRYLLPERGHTLLIKKHLPNVSYRV